MVNSDNISIHAPRTGSDNDGEIKRLYKGRLQSTLPARGATFSWWRASNCMGYFNPRSPHGERREVNCVSLVVLPISIHAPRTGSD